MARTWSKVRNARGWPQYLRLEPDDDMVAGVSISC
jgi:hypothetical protein